jgi:hypothetical protein
MFFPFFLKKFRAGTIAMEALAEAGPGAVWKSITSLLGLLPAEEDRSAL